MRCRSPIVTPSNREGCDDHDQFPEGRRGCNLDTRMKENGRLRENGTERNGVSLTGVNTSAWAYTGVSVLEHSRQWVYKELVSRGRHERCIRAVSPGHAAGEGRVPDSTTDTNIRESTRTFANSEVGGRPWRPVAQRLRHCAAGQSLPRLHPNHGTRVPVQYMVVDC